MRAATGSLWGALCQSDPCWSPQCAHARALVVLCQALWPPIHDVLRLRRPSGLSRIGGFLRGFAAGLRTPMDRKTLLFRPVSCGQPHEQQHSAKPYLRGFSRPFTHLPASSPFSRSRVPKGHRYRSRRRQDHRRELAPIDNCATGNGNALRGTFDDRRPLPAVDGFQTFDRGRILAVANNRRRRRLGTGTVLVAARLAGKAVVFDSPAC